MLEDRARLLGTSDLLEETNRSASEFHRMAYETMDELKRNREQLEKVDKNLDVIEEKTGMAQRVLSAMRRRVITNKLVLIFIILVLIAANILIIYFKWIRKSNKTPTSPVAPSPADPPKSNFF